MATDIFGNPEYFSLFFDARYNNYAWYPTVWATHPIYGTSLTLVADPKPDIPRRTVT